MARIDVFNGDADGLCALRQLRLAEPADSVLVTGMKRDIALLERVRADAGDLVTVLDVSLERNRAALLGLLARGVQVRYFDHHYAGDVPAHPGLQALIEPVRGVCTSLLVDRHLGGRFAAWAVAGAFGDGLDRPALALGARVGLGAEALATLRELGRDLNYNAYGETEADLLIPPAELYRLMSGFDDPLRFAASGGIRAQLQARRREDMAAAEAIVARWSGAAAEIFVLPDAPWSRRVSGSFANHRAGLQPPRAVAVLAPQGAGCLSVSVRVPAGARSSADAFCRSFAGGGGRSEAAGIDSLPGDGLEDFARRFLDAYG